MLLYPMSMAGSCHYLMAQRSRLSLLCDTIVETHDFQVFYLKKEMELACCLLNASSKKWHRKLILMSVGMNHSHSSKLATSKLENVEVVHLDYFWSIISATLLQRVSYHPIGIFGGRISPFLEESSKKS